MLFFHHHTITWLISHYGYGVVMALNFLESLSLPVPGESALVVAAVYAGTTHKLNIWLLITTTAGATIAGDLASFALGSWLGFWLLNRYGKYVGLNHARVKLGQYLFLRYGPKVVFFGRFLSVLRGPISFLGGANKMPWKRFIIAAAAGSAGWAALFGLVPFLFGKGAMLFARPLTITLGIIALLLVVVFMIFLHRNEARLTEEAERALPGPLGPIHA